MKIRLKLKPQNNRPKNGQVLIIIIILLFVGALVITPVLAYASTTFKTTVVSQKMDGQLYAADAGVQDAINRIYNFSNTGIQPTPPIPTTFSQSPCEYTLGDASNPSAKVNNNTIDVTISCVLNMNVPPILQYKIVSTASNGNTNTTVTSFTAKTPSLFDYVVNAAGNIDNGPNGNNAVLNGPVQSPAQGNYQSELWPTLSSLQDFYRPQVEQALEPPPSSSYTWAPPVSTNNYNPFSGDTNFPTSYFDSGLTITAQSGSTTPVLKLMGPIYVSGTSSGGGQYNGLNIGRTGGSFIIDLNNQAIFYDGPANSNSIIGGEVSFEGSGAIITNGNLDFKPNLQTSSTNFVFVYSVSGTVDFAPAQTGSFNGSVAGGGGVSIQFSPNNTLTLTEPPSNPPINFPISSSSGATWHLLTYEVNRSTNGLAIDTTTLANATEGTAYSASLQASGGAGTGYTWSGASPALPGWLSLSADGTLMGTPTTTGSYTFGVNVTDSSGASVSQVFILNVTSPASKLAFATAGQTINVGASSEVMTVQVEDDSGNPVDVASPTTINLSSSSTTGKFDTSQSGSFNNSSISLTIPAGSNSASFYYEDTTAGTPTITASSTGLTGASQQETIVASLVVFQQAVSNDPQGNTKDPTSDGTWSWTNGTTLSPSNWTGSRANNSKTGYSTVTGVGTQTLRITIENNYSGYYNSIGFTIKNNDTVPRTLTFPPGSVTPDDGNLKISWISMQGDTTTLSPGSEVLGWIYFQGLNNTSSTYTITVSFNFN